ncbi:RiPP maturation radical SAM C-methyltransferase [uncultured Paludibaculum sp.]|uniref:RiPP maturation radical SAM C-methyltransferase n=1 Tax=uncultured Paludibaculum sp. TaxID=1765020 RepID=UPI002AAA7906|nr:RiPP maturation radical SAM C-methyltransferase [uncultured Paludibaculum sp.]
MFEIALISMPFAQADVPSFPLTQLRHVVEKAGGGDVRARILYLNHDFAEFFGTGLYSEIALSMQHRTSGLGDWIFRQAAFPWTQDNADEYFARYYPRDDSETRALRETILEKRQGLLDLCERLIERYSIHIADLVGLSSMVSQNVPCFAMANLLKTRNPRQVLVMGGSNCESPMGAAILENVGAIDYVFSGPALVSFPAFVKLRMQGDEAACDRLPGVLSRMNASKYRPTRSTRNGAASACWGQFADLDDPYPLDYSEFLDSYDRLKPELRRSPQLLFQTSRGCWWGEKSQCAFCGVSQHSLPYTSMSPAKAVEQFRSLFRYEGRCARLQCVDYIIPKPYLKEVLPRLNTPPSMCIWYEAKSDLSDDDVRTLAQARVSVQVGIESLSTPSLKLMKKGSTAFQNLQLLKSCATHNVTVSWNLLVGVPGEDAFTYRKYLDDIPLLLHLPAPSGVYPIRFDRYSRYFHEPHGWGLDLRPQDCYALTYPFARTAINKLAIFFADANADAEYFTAMAEWMPKLTDTVSRWIAAWDSSARRRLQYIEAGSQTVIFDSRSGTPVEYVLSAPAAGVLECLTWPTSIERLAASLNGCACAESCIAELTDRGLVFQESGRLMSLVLPAAADPPPKVNRAALPTTP